jgi:hypothetical protein
MMFSFSTMAQNLAEATCGEVRRAGNGKILKRLQPNLFGINPKYVLKTKFENHMEISSYHFFSNVPIPELKHQRKTAFTGFSDKEKFITSKNELKQALKDHHTIWACVGEIRIPLKYYGNHAFYSDVSLEDAIEKFTKQARRHTGSSIRVNW